MYEGSVPQFPPAGTYLGKVKYRRQRTSMVGVSGYNWTFEVPGTPYQVRLTTSNWEEWQETELLEALGLSEEWKELKELKARWVKIHVRGGGCLITPVDLEAERRASYHKRYVSPGLYPARLVDLDKRLSNSSGKEMFVWKFELPVPPGLPIIYYTSFSEKARWRISQTLRALGIPKGDKVTRFKNVDVIGKHVLLELVDDAALSGFIQNKVRRVMPPEHNPSPARH
jgi:hypothetical protein